MPSYYTPLLNGETAHLRLDADEFHHLAHVKRARIGDTILLNSGKGWQAQAEVMQLTKHFADLSVSQHTYTAQETPAFALAFPLLRNKNDEWIVEKATELGAQNLFPMTTRYTVRTPSANTLERFTQTALSAIKQCDNPWLPTLHPVFPLEKTLQHIQSAGYLPVVASEKRPDQWMDSLPTDENLCFIVGPEGGFSDEEFTLISSLDIPLISLSTHILRAETAAITLAAQYQLIRRSRIDN